MSATLVGLGQIGPHTPVDVSAGTINAGRRRAFTAAPVGDVTFEFTNVPDGAQFTLVLTMPNPAVVITWPAEMVWPGGYAPSLSAEEVGVYNFVRAGASYYGQPAVPSTKVTFPTAPTGDIDGENTTFELAAQPLAGFHMGFLNGLKLKAGVGNDYTISGTTITMVTAPESGDTLEFCFIAAGDSLSTSGGTGGLGNPFYMSMMA